MCSSDLGEAVVVRAVSARADALSLVVGHEVDVDPSRRERRGSIVKRARPPDTRRVFRGRVPPRVNVHHEIDVAMRVGGRLGGNTVDRAAEAADEDFALGGRELPDRLQEQLDQAVSKLDEVVRLPVVPRARGQQGIEGRLPPRERGRADDVEIGRASCRERVCYVV